MNIFIDTQDMEERYGEELYKEYLENNNKELQKRIDKAINFIKNNMYENYCYCGSEDKLLEILGNKE